MRSEGENDFPAAHGLSSGCLKRCVFMTDAITLRSTVAGIDELAFDQRRPVLIAHRMAQFNAGPHRHFGREACVVQMHDHHIVQVIRATMASAALASQNNTSPSRMYAAVEIANSAPLRSSFGSDSSAPHTGRPQADPLAADSHRSIRIVDIAQNSFNNHHGLLLS
jgi:hypothetical protein